MSDYQSTRQVARSALSLSALTVLSAFSGLLLEMALAWRFGADQIVDAYRIASLLLIFSHQLFVGQLLPHVIIPMFSKYAAAGDLKTGFRVAFTLALILCVGALAVVGFIWANPGLLVDLLGPGLTGAGRESAITFVRYFSLATALMAWSGAIAGVIQSFRLFLVSPICQIVSNLVFLLLIAVLDRSVGIHAIAWGVLGGAILSFIIHLLAFGKVVLKSRLNWHEIVMPGPASPVVYAIRLMPPLLAMILVGQWGSLVMNRLLSELPPGTLAAFGYAWKLLLIVAIFPRSLAVVLFPNFSDAQVAADPHALPRVVTSAVRMSLFITAIPCVGLFLIREPLVQLIFGYGGMSADAARAVSAYFGVLLLASPASIVIGVLNKASFAKSDTRSPALLSAVLAVLATLLLPLGGGLGEGVGIAWAHCAMMWAGAAGFAGYQMWRYRLITSDIGKYLVRLAALCVAMLVVVGAAGKVYAHSLGNSYPIAHIAVLALVAVPVMAFVADRLDISEWHVLRHTVVRLINNRITSTR